MTDLQPLPAAGPPPPAGAPATVLPPTGAIWRPGEIHFLGPFEVPGLAPRGVRVYLPSTFTPEMPRSALYMFDGQNIFDDGPSFAGGWHLHEVVERMAQGRRRAPIAVGIDHGGEQRGLELSPFDFDGRAGKLDALLDWIAATLMPGLAGELQLIAGPAGAVLGGSSMGGLAAAYGHFARPAAWGGALSMSPSLWVGDGEMLRWVAKQPVPEVSRVYVDCGAREGKGTALPLAASLAAHLANRGYDADHLMFRPDARGAHNEAAWRRRLPKALRFFYR